MKQVALTVPPVAVKTISMGLLSLAIVLTWAPPVTAESPHGLIGHWKFDENGPGELVADFSPNQWHAARGCEPRGVFRPWQAWASVPFPGGRDD